MMNTLQHCKYELQMNKLGQYLIIYQQIADLSSKLHQSTEYKNKSVSGFGWYMK